MSAPVWLQTIGHVALHTEKVGPHTHLVVEDHSRVATQFKTTKSLSAETLTAVAPNSGAAIVITDIILSGEKASSGSITIQFTDDSDTVILFQVSTVQEPVALTVPFSGRIRGWQDARVDVVTAGVNPVTNVLISYYHLGGEGVLSFADWDAQR